MISRRNGRTIGFYYKFRSYYCFCIRANGSRVNGKNSAVDLMEKKINDLEKENESLKSVVSLSIISP